MRNTLLCAAVLAVAGHTASAVQVGSCDTWIANAQNVLWDDPTRTFANGGIRLIALDTGGEPTCCSSRLMVLYLETDAPFMSCALVTQDGDLGWSGMALSAAQSSYDPSRGLSVRVPVGLYTETGTAQGAVTVTINRATGEVTAQ